jgi:hypothetical protein
MQLHRTLFPFVFGVQHIAPDGETKVTEVDANLMGSPGGEAARDERATLNPSQDLHVRNRRASRGLDRHQRRDARVSSDGSINRKAGLSGIAKNLGHVTALGGFGFNLRRQMSVGGIGFGHHQQPGGLLIQSVHDAALMQRLAAERVPLTVCPLSNVKLCVFPSLAQHNLKQLLDAGLCVTINSDDPAYFGGYLNENYIQLFAALGLGAREAWQLASNSFEASFADETTRRGWQRQLKAFFESLREQD